MQKRYYITVYLTIHIVLFNMISIASTSSVSDDVIKRKIEREAIDTYNLRATKVKIAVENGNVVLYGTVDRYIQKMLYEKITWKTEGVVEVDNEIRVIPKFPQTDEAIERKVKEIVQTYRQFQGVKISVAVKTGAVDVIITLNNPSDVLFLKNKIAEIDGVISIDIMAKFIAFNPFALLLDGAAPWLAQAECLDVRPA